MQCLATSPAARLGCSSSQLGGSPALLQQMCCTARRQPAAVALSRRSAQRRSRALRVQAKLRPGAGTQARIDRQIDDTNPLWSLVTRVGAFSAGLIGTPVYSAAQAAVLLGMLALLDAGYSGDWSRIGVITPELEQTLMRLAQVFWFLHLLCGGAAAAIAQQQQRAVGGPFLKGFLFGLLGVFEQIEWQYVFPTTQAAAPPLKKAARR